MPLGTGVFGYYQGTEASERPDPSALFSRYIDTSTRSYAFDSATGQLQQMPPIRQRVLYALGMTKGSSLFLPDDGIDYPTRIDGEFEAKMDRAVRVALTQLTEVERVIRIESIQVVVSGSRARPIVEYTDLSTGERDTVTR
jgi:hypothetical protein